MRNVFNRLIKFFFLMMVIFLSFVSCVTTHTEPIVVDNITNLEGVLSRTKYKVRQRS